MRRGIGITSNFILGAKDWRATLDMIKAAGFDCVMIAENESFEDSIKYAREIGLCIPFVHLDYSLADFIWTSGRKQQRCIDAVVCAIKICAKYGINTAVMHLQREDCLYTLYGPDKIGIDGMMQILKAAKKHGVRIAVENLDAFNIGHVRYILDSIVSPWLGFCYDCGHHLVYTPQIDLLGKYGDRLFAVHLHDNFAKWTAGEDNSCDLHLLPGDGSIDFAEVARRLSDAGYDGPYVFEVRKNMHGGEFYAGMTDEQFAREAYLRASRFGKE